MGGDWLTDGQDGVTRYLDYFGDLQGMDEVQQDCWRGFCVVAGRGD